MIPEEQDKLQQLLQISQENNRMLHAMRREAAWAKVWGVIKLLIIIVPLIWAYYYIQPYIGQIQDLYQQVQKLQTTSVKGEKNLQDWLNKLPELNIPANNTVKTK